MGRYSIMLGLVLGLFSGTVDKVNSFIQDEKIEILEIKKSIPASICLCDFSVEDTTNAFIHGYSQGLKSCKPEIISVEKKANIHFESKDLKFDTNGDTVKYSLFRDPDTTKGFGKISRTVLRITK